MANRWGKIEIVRDFTFLGSKITADSDCNHEIKRQLIPGRKAMTNLDSVLKNRDITLLTKVHRVKAIVFPVKYRCGSWTLKQAEALKNWCFSTVVLEKPLEFPLDCKEVKPVYPKGNQSEYSLQELMLQLQYFGYMMQRADSLENTLCWERLKARGEGDNRG